VANWLFAQTTHVAVSKSKFACRVASGVYFYISSYIKIGPVVLPLWVVENRPSPLLWPLAYTTACTTVQAVMFNETVSLYRYFQTLYKSLSKITLVC